MQAFQRVGSVLFHLTLMSSLVLSVGGGCGGPGDGGNVDNTTPGTVDANGKTLLTAENAKVIDDEVASYLEERRTMTSSDARAALVSRLAGQAGVHQASLAEDGYSVWVKFTDGSVTAINTAEGFVNGKLYDPSVMRRKLENENDLAKSAVGLAAKVSPGELHYSSKNRKILLMSAASEEMGGRDVKMFEYMRDYLVDYFDWAPSDIEIKYNAEADGYRTLTVGDFAGLDQYGVAIIIAHVITRAVPPPDGADPYGFGFKVADMGEHYSYVQVSAAAAYGTEGPVAGGHVAGGADPYGFGFKQIAKTIDLDGEREKGRIIVVDQVDVFKKTHRKYLYMREDLWRENLGTLPKTFIYLVSENGSFLSSTAGIGSGTDDGDPFHFGFKVIAEKAIDAFGPEVGSFMAWDGMVDTQNALDAAWIIAWMAFGNASDVDVWSSGHIPVYAAGVDPDPTAGGVSDPFSFGFKVIAKTGAWESNLDLWPHRTGAARFLYMPTWAYVGTYGVPEQTVSTRVTMNYTDVNLTPPDPNVVQDVPHVGKEFTGLVPGQEVEIKVEALDVDENVVTDASKKVTLKTGENIIPFHFKEYGIIMEADPPVAVFDPGAEATIKVTATLRHYKEGDTSVPTGGPVIGMKLEFSNSTGSKAEMTAPPPPVYTDMNGQASVTLKASKSGGGTVTVFIEADSKGQNLSYLFQMRPANSIPGAVNGECSCDPATHNGGYRVWVEFKQQTDPKPLYYQVFGYNFYDKYAYGHWYNQKIYLTDSIVSIVGDMVRVSLTSGGGNGCTDDGVKESLDWGLGRFAGGIWWVTPVYE